MSEAAISDHTFVETTNLFPDPQTAALNKTIYDVLPSCMTEACLQQIALAETASTLVHIEAGKKIFQLYAELDSVDPDRPGELTERIRKYNPDAFAGPWALSTMGGAGGQTVVGALTTGTHGGDFKLPPIADSVLAIHLVTGNRKHYWIEPRGNETRHNVVDRDLLQARYPESQEYPGIEVLFDDALFNSVLVSAGRFGVIYSVVIKAVPQYLLVEDRRLGNWSDVKHYIHSKHPSLFDVAAPDQAFALAKSLDVPVRVEAQRFLQIAICLIPITDGKDNRVGITRRWMIPSTEKPDLGREQRIGKVLRPEIPGVQNAFFMGAGLLSSYKPEGEEFSSSGGASMLDLACQSASILIGVLDVLLDELQDFVQSEGALIGAGLATAAGVGLPTLAAMLAALALLLKALRELLDHFDEDTTFPEAIEQLRSVLANFGDAGVFLWRAIYNQVFEGQQSERTYVARSYAVMDQHSYGNHCEINVDSLEVFFSVGDSRLIAFVDSLIEFEKNQESKGKTIVGYASLRFMGSTRALLGMQQFDMTVAVEVSCMRDVSGGDELLAHAMAAASDMNANCLLHWGQSNKCSAAEIEVKFGRFQQDGTSNLTLWKKSLASFGSQVDRFSNDFTRRLGLEP